MRILFLSHYFPPEVNAPANRLHEHARRWVADGHDVTVVTGVPSHPLGEPFPGYRNRWLQEEQIDGIRVIRTWSYLAANRGFLRRTLSYVSFAASAVLASLRAERPDVVVATTPQFFCGLAGAVVARLRRRPFVLELRDLWPASIVELGQLPRGRLVKVLEALETWLYRSAAGIVVNSRAFIAHVVARGVERQRLELVHNGVDPRLFRPRPRDGSLLRQHDLEGLRLVTYVGTLGLAHGLVTLLAAAEQLREESDLVFVLVGDGADRARLEREVASRRLRNVRLLGLRPRSEVPRWIASSELVLVMLRDLPVFRTVIPSKIFEILAQGRPVLLSAPPGECRALLEEAKAGFTVDAEHPEALVRVLRHVQAHPEEAESRARAGREWVVTHFVRDDLARRMARFLERVAEAS